MKMLAHHFHIKFIVLVSLSYLVQPEFERYLVGQPSFTSYTLAEVRQTLDG